MSVEENIRGFDELVPGCAELHYLTWCVKDQRPRFTRFLTGEECVKCPHFVGNSGVCDPL